MFWWNENLKQELLEMKIQERINPIANEYNRLRISKIDIFEIIDIFPSFPDVKDYTFNEDFGILFIDFVFNADNSKVVRDTEFTSREYYINRLKRNFSHDIYYLFLKIPNLNRINMVQYVDDLEFSISVTRDEVEYAFGLPYYKCVNAISGGKVVSNSDYVTYMDIDEFFNRFVKIDKKQVYTKIVSNSDYHII